MSIADFRFLQAFVAWNLFVDEINDENRRDEANCKKLVRREFFATAAEEFMSYIDNDEASVPTITFDPTSEYTPHIIPKDYWKKHPHCIIYAMEKVVKNKTICLLVKKIGRRKSSKRKGHLDLCSCRD